MKEIGDPRLIKNETLPKVEQEDISLDAIFKNDPEILQILKDNKANTFYIYPNSAEAKNDNSERTLAVRIRHNLLLPTTENGEELPSGYAYVGGTFRSGLLHLLGIKGIQPRDLDVVNLDRNSLNNHSLVSEEFMPDDFSNGHEIETVNAYEQLSKQDFTINSGFISSKFIVATPECIQDIFNGIIYPTKFGLEQDRKSRLASRALRFYTLFKEIHGKAEIEGMPDNIWESIDLWEIGLIMQKSLEQGLEFAIEMYHSLEKFNIKPIYKGKYIINLDIFDQYSILSNLLLEVEADTTFKFRGKALEIFPVLKYNSEFQHQNKEDKVVKPKSFNQEQEELDQADNWDDIEEKLRQKK